MSARLYLFGDAMSYNVHGFSYVNTESSVADQDISTSYTEVSGSRVDIDSFSTSINVIYRFHFYARLYYNGASDYTKPFLHIKLQKSTDNFVSNVNDVSGCKFNYSGDTTEANDYHYKSCNPFFVVQDLDARYLRIVARSYATGNDAILHHVNAYAGSHPVDLDYYPSLVVVEF